MSIKYDSKREPLAEIIEKATKNATYVIPDLQRPYVWSPKQITMLVDSLFRGWPIGSLLLWEVTPDCFKENEGIPHRAFWNIVDRTEEGEGSVVLSKGPPATYRMVLDGQQRIQSLILALGEDRSGLQLSDPEWARELQERKMKSSTVTHWSRASICIDLEKFSDELEAKHNIVRKIEVGKILEWVILDLEDGLSDGKRPTSYKPPLETSEGNPSRFVRLSRFWELVKKDYSEREYKEDLEEELRKYGTKGSDYSHLLGALAEFMKVVESVKINSFVHALQIEPFRETKQWNKDDYNEAIVNIFTRLNTAGRTLTREEITLAWLKIGWQTKSTGGKSAGQCLEALKSALKGRGFTSIETDEVVRLISFIWAVEYREDRKGNLLDSKDLLQGEIIRNMAKDVANIWGKLEYRVQHCADLIEARGLIGNINSFNAVIVYLAWYRLVFNQFDTISSSMCLTERDSLQKQLNQRAAQFLDRWIYGSQWANVWSDGYGSTFQQFATTLHTFSQELKTKDAGNVAAAVDDSINQIMARISIKAIEQINNINAIERLRVRAYYPFLWVWHRLDGDRWSKSDIQMRNGRLNTKLKLEVDHTVADKWWQKLIQKQIKEKQNAFDGPDEEKALIAPNGFESEGEALAFINMLGNCSLLEKSFNISKSDKSMRQFLEEVHEFKKGEVKIGDWEIALSLPPALTSPDGASLADIQEAIKNRDTLIRKDLCDFIEGKKHRIDAD